MNVEEAIVKFERQLNAAQAVLDSGFGTLPGESNRLYMERREMAELALMGLYRMKEQEGIRVLYNTYFDLQYAPPGMTDEEKLEMAREVAVRDLARLLISEGEFHIDNENKCVRGVIRLGTE